MFKGKLFTYVIDVCNVYDVNKVCVECRRFRKFCVIKASVCVMRAREPQFGDCL